MHKFITLVLLPFLLSCSFNYGIFVLFSWNSNRLASFHFTPQLLINPSDPLESQYYVYKLCAFLLGRGCGAAGKVVASDTRDPQIESQHWQNFVKFNLCQLFVEKTKINEREARNGPLKKQCPYFRVFAPQTALLGYFPWDRNPQPLSPEPSGLSTRPRRPALIKHSV